MLCEGKLSKSRLFAGDDGVDCYSDGKPQGEGLMGQVLKEERECERGEGKWDRIWSSLWVWAGAGALLVLILFSKVIMVNVAG